MLINDSWRQDVGHSTIRFMTNRAIEMHDCKLQSIAVSTVYVVLEFSPAYIHQSEGRPGIDAGTGWTQRAVVRVRGDVVSGSLTELPYRLSSGWLTLNEQHYENEIPIPLSFDGDVELHLTFAFAEESVRVRGNRVTLELLGEADYVEQFPGADRA